MPFTGTLLVRHLDALAPAEQQRLQQWLTDAQGRAQIVSASTSALWADVERGAFHEALYYRLNVVSVDVRRGPGPSGRVTPDA
jgi:DNA-binding NtrC family response regulator